MWEKLANRFRSLVKPVRQPEKWQQQIIDEVKPFTMTSPENIFALINAVEYVVKNKIEGDIVECGVWKGGSMMAVAKALNHFEDKTRTIYLYDTFDEFPPAQQVDISYDGNTGTAVLETLEENGLPWKAPDETEVKNNLLRTGYPAEKMIFVKGQVEQTIPLNAPTQISILRLDTDWYGSTLHELQCLYPRLTKNGVLIIDDYGYWKGCKKAVDEYFEKEKITTKLIQIDFSARMIYKG
jgi:O-methyltransferase